MVGANFTVGGEAVSAQQGSIGESIRVKMANGQVVTAVVVRAGVVEIRID
jgi:flagella basal body P-ring formation protein FlgA